MDLKQLSHDDQALIEALVDIARSECMGRDWSEVEPTLADYWNQSHHEPTPLRWEDIAPLIHAHPTQSEALGEAFLALSGKPLHAL